MHVHLGISVFKCLFGIPHQSFYVTGRTIVSEISQLNPFLFDQSLVVSTVIKQVFELIPCLCLGFLLADCLFVLLQSSAL
jgi:hypothetical protein